MGGADLALHAGAGIVLVWMTHGWAACLVQGRPELGSLSLPPQTSLLLAGQLCWGGHTATTDAVRPGGACEPGGTCWGLLGRVRCRWGPNSQANPEAKRGRVPSRGDGGLAEWGHRDGTFGVARALGAMGQKRSSCWSQQGPPHTRGARCCPDTVQRGSDSSSQGLQSSLHNKLGEVMGGQPPGTMVKGDGRHWE